MGTEKERAESATSWCRKMADILCAGGFWCLMESVVSHMSCWTIYCMFWKMFFNLYLYQVFSCFLLEFVVFFSLQITTLLASARASGALVPALRGNCESETKGESVRAKRDKMCRLSKWENWGGMSSWSQNLPSGPNGSVVGSDGPCRHGTFSSVQNCSLHFRDTSYRLPGCSKFELFGKQVPFFLFLWQTKNNVIWWTCWGLHVRIAY